jgi:ABC-type multidrug transport system permease subunit
MADRPRPLVELTRARIMEFVREPEAVFWVFVFPVLLALGLGIAFRSAPPQQPRIAVSTGGGALSWAEEALAASGRLQVSELEAGEVAETLRTGAVDLVVEPPEPGSSGDAELAYRFDPERADGRVARLVVDEVLQRARGRGDPVAVAELHVTQLGARYIDFLIPGLIGLNLMGSGIWGIGFSMVMARTRKLLKRFAATPMRRPHFLLSYALSRLVFLALEVAALFGFGRLVFDVRLHGSPVDVAVIALLGAAAFSGIGLLVAARPTTVEGVSGWMNFVQLPMWVLSGSFFPYQRFPELVQPAIRLLPLTAVNDGLRAVVNDGLPLTSCAFELLVLAVWSALSFAIALRIFRWQ